MNIVLQMLIGLGAKLLSSALLEELLLFTLKTLAQSTKTNIDDKLLHIVEKHLNKG